MKKLKLILVLMLTLVSSVCFFACGSKYKNLKIEYDATEIQLFLDKEYIAYQKENDKQFDETAFEDLSSKEIVVSFSGIKAKNIGKVDVQVIPADLADINATKLVGKDLGISLSAIRAGNGEIVITHLASNKQLSIDLLVEKKAYTAETKNNKFVATIPQSFLDENEKEVEQFNLVTINSRELLTFAPFDATDRVVWNLSREVGGVEIVTNSGLVDGVYSTEDFVKEDNPNEDANNVINSTYQLKISSKAVDQNLSLKPTLIMPIFEQDESVETRYNDIVLNLEIDLLVKKVPEESKILITSSNALGNHSSIEGSDERLITGVVSLIVNPLTYNKIALGYNSVDLNFVFKDKNVLDEYKDIYNFQISSSTSQLVAENKGTSIKVTGLNYSANVEWLKIKFVPKNAVGNIMPFEKIVEFNLIETAERIAISENNSEFYLAEDKNEDKIDSTEITLLDYYTNYSDYGQKFNFRAHKITTDDSFSSLQIVVDSTILSSNNGGSASNQFLLRFYKGTRAMTFTSTGDNKAVSESFRQTDNIYIKYEINDTEGAGSNELTFTVKNIYDGSLNDYKSENGLFTLEKSVEINVTRSRGIKSIDLTGSNVRAKEDGGYSFNGSNDNYIYVLKDAIVTSHEFENNNKIAYGVRISNIKDSSDNNLNSIELAELNLNYTISKNGEIVDSFKLGLFRATGAGNSFDLLRENNFNITDDTGESNHISLLLFENDKDIELGDYIITISQELSGYSNTFSYRVVQNVGVNDFIVKPFNDMTNITKQGYSSYIDEKNNQILRMPVDSSINMEIVTGSEVYNLLQNNASWKENYYYTLNGNSYSLVETEDDFNLHKTNNIEMYTKSFVANAELQKSINSINVMVNTVKADGEAHTNSMSYITYLADNNNSACLTGVVSSGLFGSVYNGEVYYAELKVSIKSKKYAINGENFYIEEKSDTSSDKLIKIFVYIPVTEAYFVGQEGYSEINSTASVTTLNLYNPSKLGAYTADGAKAELTLKVKNNYNESQSMFDYLTLVDNAGKETNAWLNGNVMIFANYEGYKVTFNLNANINTGNYRVYARINQYGVTRDIVCNVNVIDPIITRKITVNNPLQLLNDEKYVYLKLGDSFTFNVTQTSNPTFKGFKYVVCDAVGQLHANYYISEDGVLKNSGVDEIKGNDDDENVVNKSGDFKVIIFAKDWLRISVDSNLNSFNFKNLTEYLLDDDYNDRVQIVSFKVRDGSKATPYLLTTTQDIKGLASGDNNYYYELVNDINMAGTNPQIDVFSGNLSSYREYILLDKKPTDWDDNYTNYYYYSLTDGYIQLTKQENAPAFVYNHYFKLNQHRYTIYNLNLSSPFINYIGVFEEVNKGVENNEPSDYKTDETQYFVLDDNLKYQRVINDTAWDKKIRYYKLKTVAKDDDITQLANINFRVSFIGADSQNLGLIGLSYYDLINVSVEMSGNLTLKYKEVGSNNYNLGGLVAENYGNISYTDINITAVSGDLEIKKDAKINVNAGGLVGVNYAGNIQGCYAQTTYEETVSYGLFYDDQTATFVGSLNLSNIDNAEIDSDDNSTLGGIIGTNKKGIISNVYVAGEIQGLNNVGGVIGYNSGVIYKNIYTDVSSLNDDDIADLIGSNPSKLSIVKHSLVTTKVIGKNYVGGLTGKDEYGVYYHSYYEVYKQQSSTAVKGEQYVGGLIGSTYLGALKYCYFHSFKWDYGDTGSVTDNDENGKADELEAFENDNPDILGGSYVGGLIGFADSNNAGQKDDHVKIYNSLVDAYIKGGSSTSSIAGRYKGYLTIVNGYAQGYIENASDEEYKITNSITNTETKEITTFYNYILGKVGTEDPISHDMVYSYALINDWNESFGDSSFKRDVNINNDRHYLVYNNSPLVTLAPSSISIDQDAFDTDFNRVSTEFYDENGDTTTPSQATVVLYLYDLINNNSSNYSNDKRTINLLALDNIIKREELKITPNSVKSARVRVLSSDTSIIEVLNNGTVLLKSEGVCELSFISVIDETVSTSIKVVVTKMPETFEIYKNVSLDEVSILNGSYINIVKGESKFVYENYTGDIVVNGQAYNYTLSNQTSLWITNDDNDTMISVNNQDFETDDTVIKINDRTPLVFSVDESAKPHEYSIEVHPYLYYTVGETTYYLKVIEDSRTFKINTRKGVSTIATNITDAVISVADELSFELILNTDESIESLDVSIEIFDEQGNASSCLDEKGDNIYNNEVFEFLVGNENKLSNGKLTLSKKVDNNIQTDLFNIRLNQDVKITKDLFAKIKFRYQNVEHEIEITLIPQNISSIISINYKQETANKWNSSNIIRPGTPNMIVINVAPNNAYYEYLEITDVTLNEKISFIQFSDFNSEQAGLSGSALGKLDEISSDGYGIKLKKQYKNDALLPMYVYTLLDELATRNVDHVIRVTAYSSTGYELGTSLITLKAVLYPRVQVTYIDALGREDVSVDSAKTLGNSTETDLAIGVEAKLDVKTFTTDELSWEVSYLDEKGSEITDENLTKDKLNIYNTEPTVKKDGYYYLTIKNISNLEVGDYFTKVKSIKLTAIVTKYTNGVAETSEAYITFNLKQMTLNNVSAKTNKATSNNRLGGVIGDDLELEFYFAPTDISMYSNNSYWKTSYTLDDYSDTDNIKTLLTTLNSVGNGVSLYLKLPNGEEKKLEFTDLTDNDNTDNILIESIAEYKSENGETYLTLTKYEKDNDNDGSSDDNISRLKIKVHNSYINQCQLGIRVNYYYNDSGIAQIGTTESERNKTLNVTYGFNFASVSTLYDYIPVNSALDFTNMVEGGYYILTSDITLNNYDMLDLPLGGFDGNGHTITIKSFNYESMASKSSDKIGYFGLFKQIYTDEIIKNVTLNYELKYDYNIDLCEYEVVEGEYYTSINFGGIAPINNGIITNCLLTGEIGISASKIAPSSFRFAGITCTNTGYITNTSVQLDLYGGAIVAGAVVDNSGKISSSNYTGNISAYSSSTLSNQIQTAGFVMSNQGEIAFCYVGDLKQEDSNKLASAGSIGGFVFTNSGFIKDSYLANITFDSRGEVGGFVHTSTGSIERCYINADNSSLIGARQKDLFALYKDNGTFTNCYFIAEAITAYDKAGIECITQNDLTTTNRYKNYIFSGDDFGIWTMTINGPILNNSTHLIKQKSSVSNTVNGEQKISYIVSGTKEIPYLIYNVETYQYYMSQNDNGTLYGYYRFVADINLDIDILKDKPISTLYNFSGQIEGNNMAIQNYGLFPDEKSEESGLFKQVIQLPQKTSFINNLVLQPKTIRSSNASMVGALAGVVDGGFVYNVTINSPGVTVIGKNAVGGLAGIIRGDFRINGISSNVSVNSAYRQTIGSKLNLYSGKVNTNSASSSNINAVSYAGAIAGIVEGYNSMTESSTLINTYSRISNCYATGDITIIGEVVGGMFGLISEKTYAENLTFDVTNNTTLKGVYYSGGLVGENRGVITNSTVNSPIDKIDLFFSESETKFSLVSGGIVAVNYGGLIHNSTNYANVVSNYHLATVGGIAGRNSHGTIAGCVNLGGVYGLFSGGIVGADYDYTTMNNAGNATGSITDATKYVLPKENKDYSSLHLNVNGNSLTTDAYQGITIENLDQWFSSQLKFLEETMQKGIGSFYSTERNSKESELRIKTSRVLGAIIGVTDKEIVSENDNNVLKINNIDTAFINQINTTSYKGLLFSNSTEDIEKDTDPDNTYTYLQKYLFDNSNSEYYYFVAVTKASYDFWNLNDGYSNGYLKIYSTK